MHAQFVYDAASRLQNVTNVSSTVAYSYLAKASLAGQILFKQSGTTEKGNNDELEMDRSTLAMGSWTPVSNLLIIRRTNKSLKSVNSHLHDAKARSYPYSYSTMNHRCPPHFDIL